MSENPAIRPPSVLIPLAREGSEAALGELYEAYRGYLHLLARMQIRQRLQGKVDPSDVVQETFMRVKAGLADFRGTSEAELVGWLRRILSRTLVDHMRRFETTLKRSHQLECRLDVDVDRSSQCLASALPSPTSTPSARAARREEAVLVANALERLPEHYKEVIMLRNFEQLTFPEIAHEMQRSAESVRKLWPRALKQLQRELSR